jgi:AraC family transcriptional regulator
MSHLNRCGEPVSYGSMRFRNRTVADLLLTDARFPAAGGLPSHFHDRAVVATTFAGGFESRMAGRAYWQTPSMTIVEPAGERHENRFGGSGARVLALQPDPRSDRLAPFAALLATPRQVQHPALVTLAWRLSAEIGAADSAASLALEGLALELLATAVRQLDTPRGARPAWLLAVRDRLHDDCAVAPSLGDLSSIANVHPGHLTRAFRRAFHCSVGEYLRDVRLTRAAQRLATSEDPLARVAAEAGFADQSHFTRLFRRRFGCTPAVFRQRCGHA